jgi:glyoxylase-like metal-dependent hydrolase (beta-lactamase superfamily II)
MEVEMSTAIYPVSLGMNRCYVVQGETAIMVDGGFPGSVGAFRRAMARISVDPHDIRLVALTHGHFDHVGSASHIRDLTGAEIALHRADQMRLEEDRMTWPPGVTAWGKISRALFKPMMSLLPFRIPPIDVVLGDDGLSLAAYGIAGKVIHTPGHSPGSVSVLLDTGEAFVGCMAQNSLPFCLRPSLPIYADDIEELKKSWQLLMDEGARTIYPGHGRPFPVDALRDVM